MYQGTLDILGKDGYEGEVMLGSLSADVDEFSRILTLEVDEGGLDDTDDMALRIDEGLDYNNLFGDAESVTVSELDHSVLILWHFRTGQYNDGGLYANARIPVAGEDVSLEIAVPPYGLRGRELKEWLDESDEQRRRPEIEELYSYLHRSAAWLLRRVVRREPVVEIGKEWEDVTLLEGCSDLLRIAKRVPALSIHPVLLVRVKMTPNLDSAKTNRKRPLKWPIIQVDVLVRKDGFVALTRDHFGFWSHYGADSVGGHINLSAESELIIHGYDKEPVAWPTNIASIPIADMGKLAVWRSDWQSSCGYDMQVVDQRTLVRK